MDAAFNLLKADVAASIQLEGSLRGKSAGADEVLARSSGPLLKTLLSESRKARQRQEDAGPRPLDASDHGLSQWTRFTDGSALKKYGPFLHYVPRLVNIVTLAEALPVPGGGATLPLDLAAIASRCTGSYYAPRRFAVRSSPFSTARQSRRRERLTPRVFARAGDPARVPHAARARARVPYAAPPTPPTPPAPLLRADVFPGAVQTLAGSWAPAPAPATPRASPSSWRSASSPRRPASSCTSPSSTSSTASAPSASAPRSTATPSPPRTPRRRTTTRRALSVWRGARKTRPSAAVRAPLHVFWFRSSPS